ncbi:hypothetical protein MRX96_017553 [Rhipicephalus microplus]
MRVGRLNCLPGVSRLRALHGAEIREDRHRSKLARRVTESRARRRTRLTTRRRLCSSTLLRAARVQTPTKTHSGLIAPAHAAPKQDSRGPFRCTSLFRVY